MRSNRDRAQAIAMAEGWGRKAAADPTRTEDSNPYVAADQREAWAREFRDTRARAREGGGNGKD